MRYLDMTGKIALTLFLLFSQIVPKDNTFYDKESSVYSSKRYSDKPSSYTQFFFGERLKITLRLLEKCLTGRTDLSFLDIGCADGFVLNEIYKHFPTTFSSIVGIDVSPKMIETASIRYTSEPYFFKLR